MRTLLAIAVVLAATAFVLRLACAPEHDPAGALSRRYSPVTAVRREPAATLGSGFERWSIATASGDTVRGLWRRADTTTAATWTVVLLGGLQTGERAALVVPGPLPVHVLAMDWPWRGPRRMGRLEFLRRLPAIREAVVRSPTVLAAGMDAAATQADCDRRRIAVLGASLGVPPALGATRLTRNARAVILVDGAADLRGLLDHQLRRASVPRVACAPLAALGAWLARPLEPELHGPALADRPVLLFNARSDERLPASCTARLHACLPEAEIRWRDAPHIRTGQVETIASLTRESAAWLAGLDGGSASIGGTPTR